MAAVTTQQWVCPTCRQGNPMDADDCAGCGASFASHLRAEPTARRDRDRARGVAAGLREIAVVFGLFVLWKLASAVSVMDTAGAFARGRWIWRVEQTLRLPSELSVQNGIIGHPGVVQLLNTFYLAAHLGSIVVVLPWLFLRHRSQYMRWRNLIAVFTGLSLLIQLVSVAPPRLLPQLGFVDTAALYHQSAYDHLGSGMVDQLSSVPSIHVGWAIIIAMAVVSVSTSRWRWLVLAHPVLTGYAVVATANHFWLDGIAAAGLVGIVYATQNCLSRRRRPRS
jgi:PAP2 superfamily